MLQLGISSILGICKNITTSTIYTIATNYVFNDMVPQEHIQLLWSITGFQ